MLATALSTALALGTLVVADAAPCRADVATDAATPAAAPAPDVAAAPQPGSDEEERAYAQREAESPGAEKFNGGFVFELILIVLLVIVIILIVE